MKLFTEWCLPATNHKPTVVSTCFLVNVHTEAYISNAYACKLRFSEKEAVWMGGIG